MTIYEFAKIIRADIEIRKPFDKNVFYASFKNAEIIKNGYISDPFGSGEGKTPEIAINNYSKKISKKTLVFDFHSAARKSIDVPKLEIRR